MSKIVSNTKWLIANASPLSDEDLRGSVLTLTDITEVKRSQARVDYMSVTDMLTDLPNRGRLLTELALKSKECMDDGGWVALLVVVLDRFKLVNETHGHSAGDDLLLRLADRLRAHLPQGGLLARISADEFGFVIRIDAPSFKQARRHTEQFATQLNEAIRQPFLTRYEPIQTRASIGIVLTEGSTVNSETVLQYGSLALALAKEAGGDCWRIFEPSLLEGPKSRFYAESALRDGLRAEEFELYFQPKIELRTGKLKGVEALIRWNRLGQGLLDQSKIEAGKLSIEAVKFSLRDSVTAPFRAYHALAESRGLRMELRIGPDVPERVVGDRIRQVLGNYLNNALRFTAAGGIEIVVRRLADARISSRRATRVEASIEPVAKASFSRSCSWMAR